MAAAQVVNQRAAQLKRTAAARQLNMSHQATAAKRAATNPLASPPAVSGGGGGQWGCRKCVGCRTEDCGQCQYCLDKPKFGGANTLKKKCIQRRCIAPQATPVRSTLAVRRSLK